MGERDERNRTEFGLKRNHRTVENRPGGTHPRAEQGAMGGSLMLGMMPGMFDRLRLRQSADGKDTDHQEDRQDFEGAVVHRKTTQGNLTECYWMATRPVKTATRSLPDNAFVMRRRRRGQMRGRRPGKTGGVFTGIH